MAETLPCADELATLTPEEEARATQVLGGIRSRVGTTISLLAADIERKSARELGTDGLAQRNGFKDSVGLVQDATGLGHAEAAQLIRVGELLYTAQAVTPVHDSAGVPSFEPGNARWRHWRPARHMGCTRGRRRAGSVAERCAG